MATPDLDTINAASLGMNPNDYKLLKQKKDQMLLAQNTPQSTWLPDSTPTQADLNQQSLSTDRAPAQEAPQAQDSSQLQMPAQDVSAPAPQELTAPDFSGQQQSIADMKAGLQKYLAQPQQVDLSSLAGLTDAWSQNGSKLAQSYKAPTSPEERQVMAEKLQNMINQAQTGLSTEQSKYLTAQANREANSVYRDQLLEAKRHNKTAEQDMANVRADQRQAGLYTDAVNKANNAKGAAKAANTNLVNIKNALSIIDEAPNGDYNQISPTRYNMLITEMGRVASGGVTSEHTQNLLSANTLDSNWANFMQKVGNAPKPAELGEFVKQNKEYLDDLYKNNKEVADNWVKHSYGAVKNRLGKQQQQDFQDEFPDTFNPPKIPAPPPMNSGGGGVAKNYDAMSDEELQKELNGR
jgi:hypothetical protein